MNKVMVLCTHNKKNKIKTAQLAGPCCLCDENVYLARYGVSGELEIAELRKIKNLKLIGNECLQALVKNFIAIIDMPKAKRQEILDGLLKKEFGEYD